MDNYQIVQSKSIKNPGWLIMRPDGSIIDGAAMDRDVAEKWAEILNSFRLDKPISHANGV